MTVELRSLACYDRRQSYDWNYRLAPLPLEIDIPPMPGEWRFCGLPVNSPIGIAAGPLLNGAWCRYYASLGYDVLTYKTVRSTPRQCYSAPNLVPVDCRSLASEGAVLRTCSQMDDSWAVSFGMPSQPPEVWRADVEQTRRALPSGKILVVSVVASVPEEVSLTEDEGREQIAADYARLARWAKDSGADAVEANLSCPNVSTCDGRLYRSASTSALVAECMREAVGQTPIILKIGWLPDDAQARDLVAAVRPWVDALSMTNCIAAQVVDSRRSPAEEPLFGGQPRGIAGAAIREASLAQVRRFRELENSFAGCDGTPALGRKLRLIGVGGAATVQHVQDYLQAGAHAVHLATAAMINPLAAIEIRRNWPPIDSVAMHSRETKVDDRPST